MADETVTPIRPNLVETIEVRAQEIRELIFQAQSIVIVLSVASMAQPPPHKWSVEKALEVTNRLLDNAAGRLEPGMLTEVAHG